MKLISTTALSKSLGISTKELFGKMENQAQQHGARSLIYDFPKRAGFNFKLTGAGTNKNFKINFV